jgi:hypothetical protein
MVRQNFGTGGSPSGNVDTSATACSVTTSWQKFTRTFTVPSISSKTLGTTVDTHYLQLQFACPLNATMTIDLAQVQLEAGSVSTPFEVEPFETTLRKCQRYYEKSYKYDTLPGTSNAQEGLARVTNTSNGGGEVIFMVFFAVPKRVPPNILAFNFNGAAGTWTQTRPNVFVTNAPTFAYVTEKSFSPYYVFAAAWTTTDHYGHWVANAEL